MLRWSKCYLLLAISLFVTAKASRPTITPPVSLVKAGNTTGFVCQVEDEEPVYWTVRRFGETNQREIYIGEKYLLEEFATSGRFKVNVNRTQKTYELVIDNAQMSDGGVYACIGERGLGRKAYVELIVWNDMQCKELNSPNVNYYMGENVLGQKQDVLVLNCSLKYVGNQRPKLLWDSKAFQRLDGDQGQSIGTASSQLNVTATSSLNGVNVSCIAVVYKRQSSDVLYNHSDALWTSAAIKVSHAILRTGSSKECPGTKQVPDCWPPCSFHLVKYENGSSVCRMVFYEGWQRTQLTIDVIRYEANSPVTNPIAIAVSIAIIGIAIIGIGIATFFLIRKRSKPKTQRNADNQETIGLNSGEVEVNNFTEQPVRSNEQGEGTPMAEAEDSV